MGYTRQPDRSGHGSACRMDLCLGSLVRLAGRCLPAGLPAGFLVPRGHRIPLCFCPPGDAQRPCPPSAPDEQARDMALAALPRHHGHCPDHGRGRHRRVQELHLPGLLPVPHRFCRGLLFPLAQSHLDDDSRRCLLCRVLDGGLLSRPRCGQGEGAGGEVGGVVYQSCWA